MSLFNLEDQLVFYGQYHHGHLYALSTAYFRNILLHAISAPILYWTFMIIVGKLPLIVVFDRFFLNVSFLLTFFNIFYYMLLEPIAGVTRNIC